MNNGFIKLYRKITETDIWQDKPYARGQAFIDLIMKAYFTKGIKIYNGNEYIINRGEALVTDKMLMNDWGWSKSKVRKYLNQLKQQHKIDYKRDNKKTILTIINYDSYQNYGNAKDNTENNTKDNTKTEKKDFKNETITFINNKNNINNKNIHKNNTQIFNQIWDLYDKKIDKKRAEAKFRKIPANEYEKLIQHLKLYVKSTPEKKYRKNLITYLNAEDWNNPDAIGELKQKIEDNERLEKPDYNPITMI